MGPCSICVYHKSESIRDTHDACVCRPALGGMDAPPASVHSTGATRIGCSTTTLCNAGPVGQTIPGSSQQYDSKTAIAETLALSIL